MLQDTLRDSSLTLRMTELYDEIPCTLNLRRTCQGIAKDASNPHLEAN